MMKKLAALLLALVLTLPALSLAQEDKTVLPQGETLTYWTVMSSPYAATPDDIEYFKLIEQATGVDCSFISGSGGSEALSLLIVADQIPDIIDDYWGNFPGGIDKCLADEVIMPLNDLMDAGYMPNFVKYLSEHPEVDRLCKNDAGQYYNVPMIRADDSYMVFNGNIVRKDWLDELGLEVPTTLQEMEDVLLAFKEKKGATAGYTVAWNNYSRTVYAFGIAEDFYINQDGKVDYGYLRSEYKDFLTLMNRWIEMGIADPDMFTQSYDTWSTKIASGKTGFVWGNTGGELGSKLQSIKADVPGMDWIPVPNPTLDKEGSFPMDIRASVVNGVGASISSTCKYPEAAAKFLDYVFSEEGIVLSNFGVEGVTFERGADGSISFTDFVKNNPDGYSQEQVLNHYMGQKNKSFINTKAYMDLTYALPVQLESVNLWKTDNAVCKLMPNVTLNADETSEYSSIMSEIQTYVDEMKLKYMLGSESLDSFDNFASTLHSMGIDRAIEIRQAAYDRFLQR